jgi:glucose-1-phosphate thymidylyltransferase
MFNVVLLAAGYATRLYPLTENFPKPLLKVAGKPILEFLLESLKPLVPQMNEIVCVTNDKYTGPFEDWKRTFSFPRPIRILNDGTRSNETRLGAIRDLELGLRSLPAGQDLMVFASDNIFTFDVAHFYQKAALRPEGITLACYDVKDLVLAKQYGILEIDSSSKIVKFTEKPKEPHSTLASTGIYYFPAATHRFFSEFLNTKGANPDAPGFFISWLLGRAQLFGEALEGIWYDIGDLASLKNADQVFTQFTKGAKTK